MWPSLLSHFRHQLLGSGRSNDLKKLILEKFKRDEFYLLNLSELPSSQLQKSLELQHTALVDKIKQNADIETKIIFIKANVYDIVFPRLQQDGFDNVIDVRMPFPGEGGQIRFQVEFKRRLSWPVILNNQRLLIS